MARTAGVVSTRRWARPRWPVAIGAVAVCAASAAPDAAASCAPPVPSIVWSYPADGQSDVPVNATVWLLLSNGHRPELVQLDDQELVPNAFGFGYVPAPLAAGAPHTITFRATPPTQQPPAELTLRFTTGAGEAERISPDVPFVLSVTATQQRDLSGRCRAVVQAMGCFDTGQNTHVVFHTEVQPLLWIVERIPSAMAEAPVFDLWPGDCGLPEVFVHDEVARACAHRYRLHAVTVPGLRSIGKPICPNELVRAGDTPDGGAPSATTADASAMGRPPAPAPGVAPPDGAQNPPPASGTVEGRACSVGPWHTEATTARPAALLLLALAIAARHGLRRRR